MYELWRNLVPCKNALKEKENGEFLIVSSACLEIFYLNDSAREVILLMDGHSSVERIIDRMMGIYDVERAVLENDIIDVIRELQWKNLILLRRRAA